MDEKTIAVLLNEFMYMGLNLESGEKKTIGEFLDSVSGDNKYTDLPEYQILCQAVKEHPGFGNIQWKNDSKNMGGQYEGCRAGVFLDPETGTYYTAFQGTGDGEWVDNGLGMVQEETLQQQKASQFFDQAAEENGWSKEDKIIVCGHSKGGNKAQFVTLDAKNRDLIQRCYSLDGQGFSPEAIRYYQSLLGEDYEKALKKMYGINGENDPVNKLGITIIPEKNISYIEQKEGGLAGTHDLKYLLARKGEDGNLHFMTSLNPEVRDSSVFAQYVENISASMMELPRENRKQVAVTVMQVIETYTGVMKEGVNGEKVDLNAENLWKAFDALGPMVLGELLYTEEGRRVLYEYAGPIFIKMSTVDKLKTVAVIGFASMIIPPTIKIKALTYGIFETIKDTIKEGAAFVKTCFENVKENVAKVWNWITGGGGDTGLREAAFSIELARTEEQVESLESQKTTIRQMAEELKNIHKNMDLIMKLNPILAFQIRVLKTRLGLLADMAAEMKEGLGAVCTAYRQGDQRAAGIYQG